MRSTTFLASFLCAILTSALPTDNNYKHLTQARQQDAPQSVVTLRLVPASPTYNAKHKSQQQQLSTTTADILTVIVGQTISLDTNPLRLQGIELLNVSEGMSLSGENVVPEEVRCTAAKGFSSQTVDLRLGGGAVVLNGGKSVVVSRIECS
ncbi:hypothetical protein K504DRAFT_506431 [Pleomassaria siparia CBS 279.74]|uniref:Uncharacterized protein n=1 Tax=Pleomassaria siparia CBS 279.74 TaxID=1314801 RepID=A0A6G1JXR0_9PLEO|nr:hypothetical protein K504DRAFT_506431 [Pleomassaria siparia CBS 279.74]